jgi:KDO2-lipid IV(A) lauroyltransferase
MAKKKAVKFRRRFYGRIGSIPLKVLLFILRLLPLKCLYIVGERTAQLAFRVLKRRRHITLDNLRLALGDEKSEGEILQIYTSMLRNIARGGVEFLSYPRLRNGYFNEMIHIEGREHLDEALKLGKGVVALSIHMGNFPFVPIELTRQGYSVSVILRYPRLEGMARYLDAIGDRAGVVIIPDKPSRVCVGQSLKSLKENGVLFVLMDLNVSRGGVYVDFFGRMVPTFKGPVVLAMRTGASILPVFIIREDGNRHRILIEPPINLELTGHMEADIFTNLTKLSKIAESYIRKYPDQWWWIHRRWRKARPL